MSLGFRYQADINEQIRALELIKRKLRTSIIIKVSKTLRIQDLRHLYYTIHHEKPAPGQLPGIQTITTNRESYRYVAVFVSIYRNASRCNIRTEMDVEALMFAWDYFCLTFPGHIRERRPYGNIRPANFDEAWAIAESVQAGLIELSYCHRCHHNFLINYYSHLQPICQLCAIKKRPGPKPKPKTEQTINQVV